MSGANSNKAFLSGQGEIPKALFVGGGSILGNIDPGKKSSLLGKLDMFLPQLQQANQNLPTVGSASAVQVIFDNSDEDEDDDEEEEEVNERTVEMNIQMFPMDSEDDDDGDDGDLPLKQHRVEEMD
ncbi:hypothetical protein BASA81_002942 [Batrachochytrium salamandrivorans]|nr:hypothetical protein BASA81_002942 [Batrachochytrium salamandrivorans]